MQAISKMKTLISSPYSTLALYLPQARPISRVSFASNSGICRTYRSSGVLPGEHSICPGKSGCSTIPDREMQTEALRLPSSSGEIHVIVGPMFAGKTKTLLHRIQSESANGRSVAVIKSCKDIRYGIDSIVTHDGERYPCWALSSLSSFRQKLGSHDYDRLEVIGIDEAQFFEELYDFCREAADHDGKTIVVAGLDGDYLRRSFGSVLDIIPLADSVTKLTARCELCGKRAFFTLRKSEETKTELIGGADVYMPVCRQHYVSGQGVVEAARVFLESQNVQCELYT